MWKNYGFQATSPLDALLESPDCTLEALLDESDIIQECKAQNKALVDLFAPPPPLFLSPTHKRPGDDHLLFSRSHHHHAALRSQRSSSKLWST